MDARATFLRGGYVMMYAMRGNGVKRTSGIFTEVRIAAAIQLRSFPLNDKMSAVRSSRKMRNVPSFNCTGTSLHTQRLSGIGDPTTVIVFWLLRGFFPFSLC